MLRWMTSLALLLVLGATGYASYRLLRAGLESDVYRARLEAVVEDYAALREQYQDAIRKTAVTELLVRDGRLEIAIRTADGQRQVFETPFDPSKEIYIDFVVVAGRLWIRRVFDSETAPDKGMTIDPHYVDLQWNADNALHGKAVYRSLDEGRWVVTVTGGGALGLAKLPEEARAELTAAPALREFVPVDRAVDAALEEIHAEEVFETLVRELVPTHRSLQSP